MVVSSTQQIIWRPPLLIETVSLTIRLSLALADIFLPIYFSIEAASVSGKLIDLVRGAEKSESVQSEDTDRNTVFGNLFALLAMSVWFGSGGFLTLLSLAVRTLRKGIAASTRQYISTLGDSMDASTSNSLGALASATIDAVIATLAGCAILVLPVIAVAVLIDLSSLAIGRMANLPNISFELNCLKQLAALFIVAHLMGNEFITMMLSR